MILGRTDTVCMCVCGGVLRVWGLRSGQILFRINCNVVVIVWTEIAFVEYWLCDLCGPLTLSGPYFPP